MLVFFKTWDMFWFRWASRIHQLS